MLDFRDAMDLYSDMNDMVLDHMHSMAADHNVSDMELTAEASAMADILISHAVNILITEKDPVMLPVYAFLCQKLSKSIEAVLDNATNDKEARK